MPKIIISADIHCGINDRLDDCLWALRTIREYAKKNDVHVIAMLGDLFHDRVNLNIKVISEVAEFLDECKYKYDQDWIITVGNHDSFLRHTWSINSIRPLKRLITLIDDVGYIKIFGAGFRIIPFIQNEESYMKVLETVNNKASEDDVLLTHIGISGASNNTCFLLKHWGSVNFEDTKFKRVFAGHFHNYQEVGKATIVGSPIPFRFDEGMIRHGFCVYDLDSNQTEFVDIGVGVDLVGGVKPPDFITITESDILKIEPNHANIRIMLESIKSRDELDRLRTLLLDKGALKVSWMKMKEDDKKYADDIGSNEPLNLFEKFVDFDKPELDKKLLISLNKQIVDQAFERISQQDAIDE